MKHKPENPFIHGNYLPNTIIMSLPRNNKTVPNLIKLTQRHNTIPSFQFVLSTQTQKSKQIYHILGLLFLPTVVLCICIQPTHQSSLKSNTASGHQIQWRKGRGDEAKAKALVVVVVASKVGKKSIKNYT